MPCYAMLCHAAERSSCVQQRPVWQPRHARSAQAVQLNQIFMPRTCIHYQFAASLCVLILSEWKLRKASCVAGADDMSVPASTCLHSARATATAVEDGLCGIVGVARCSAGRLTQGTALFQSHGAR